MAIKYLDVRDHFPILKKEINNQKLIYLDNAATTQKPKQVINKMTDFYENYNANIYRSVHTLSGEATSSYEEARQKIAHFINANKNEEIIFTKGTTSSINLLAQSLAVKLNPGDEILLTYMEHHSNIIPWQQVAKEKNAKLVYVKVTAEGRIDLEDYKRKLNERTKIVSFTHVSNVLGTINPVEKMTQWAKDENALVIVDGAQAISHFKVDVNKLGADFYVFSGHKMYGPTGIGILYGKEDLLEKLKPSEFGGEMIEIVNENESTWAQLPNKFEAGTPNISGAIGLAAAVEYLENIGIENIEKYEKSIQKYLLVKLKELEGIILYGPKNTKDRVGVVSFNLDGVHPHDLATALDLDGIAIRAGHHCGQLLMKELDVIATSRISLSFYNTKDEIDKLIKSLNKAKEFFQ